MTYAGQESSQNNFIFINDCNILYPFVFTFELSWQVPTVSKLFLLVTLPSNYQDLTLLSSKDTLNCSQELLLSLLPYLGQPRVGQ